MTLINGAHQSETEDTFNILGDIFHCKKQKMELYGELYCAFGFLL